MTAQLKSWAAALGGEICGKGVVCPLERRLLIHCLLELWRPAGATAH
jgi:hypothetical protein